MLCDLTAESVIKVTGTVRQRPVGQENKVRVAVCPDSQSNNESKPMFLQVFLNYSFSFEKM